MTEKPKPDQDATGRFKTGNIGGGRPKGARGVLSEAFLIDMQAAWEASGSEVIARVIADKPQDFLKVVASLLPKDINLNVNPTDEMTDDQLIQRIRSLDAVIRPFLSVERASAVDSGAGPETAH